MLLTFLEHLLCDRNCMNPVIGAPLNLSTVLFYRRGNWGLERMNNSLRVTQSAPSRTWTLVHQSLKIVFYPHHRLPYYWFHYIILFPSSNMYYLQIQWFLLAMFQFSLIKYKSYVPICQFIWRSKQDVKITLSLPLKKGKKKKKKGLAQTHQTHLQKYGGQIWRYP